MFGRLYGHLSLITILTTKINHMLCSYGKRITKTIFCKKNYLSGINMAKPGSFMKTVQPKTYPSDRGKMQCIVESAAAAF